MSNFSIVKLGVYVHVVEMEESQSHIVNLIILFCILFIVRHKS